MSEAGDEDLRDVFRLLYDGEDEDWASLDEDDHPPLDSIVPDIEIDIDTSVIEEEVGYLQNTYSRKRFRSQLDSLIFSPSTKKRRIYPSSLISPSERYYLSTTPLPPLPSISTFDPFSPLAFLSRIRTFHPSAYSPFYPRSISPAILAGNGWCSSSLHKDGLSCGSCGAIWGVGGLGGIKDVRVREEIGRRLALGMVGRHRDGCGWKVLSCPENMVKRLRNTLHPPLASNIASLSESLAASSSSSMLESINLKTHLSEKQIQKLLFAISRYTSIGGTNTAQLALFGWAPHPLSNEILSCRLCQRRVGLWTFLPSPASAAGGDGEGKQLDPSGEHLGWCPLREEGWWSDCELLKGGKGSVGDIKVGKGVKRRKWIKGQF